MDIKIFETKHILGKESAIHAAIEIRKAIDEKGVANIILATGASQLETLGHLIKTRGIEWSNVVMFHLDEYLEMPDTHPASFRKYLQERFVNWVPELKRVHFIKGDHHNPDEECRRLSQIISRNPIDVALVGIGENGHLAFNDPPADFDTDKPYIVVNLDEDCRRQQLAEGWFDTIDDVPRKAISMSVKQILKSKCIVCSVPDLRKAQAVKKCMEGNISNYCPASILQKHRNCTIYLDKDSASFMYV
jgi:glucosamine-6-phosphate deaminase